jgi:hypothetical protein
MHANSEDRNGCIDYLTIWVSPEAAIAKSALAMSSVFIRGVL